MRPAKPRAPSRGCHPLPRILLSLALVLSVSTATGTALADVGTTHHTGAASGDGAAWCQWVPTHPACAGALEVDQRYNVRGSWAVSTGTADVPAAGGVHYWYPTNLGSGGYRHPILTWGNGSDATPGHYDEALAHLASWGYVVVASDSGQVGLGGEMLAAARWMIDQNARAGSIFQGKLNTTRVGSLGHSQGASGAVWAQVDSNLITSTVAIAFPDRAWWNPPAPPESELVFNDVDQPTFYMAGSLDFLATSDQQLFFDLTAGPSVKAALLWGGHNDIQDGGNPAALLGYITAWFKYTLEGDTFARTAFVGSSPSELEENPAWSNQTQKALP